MPRERWSKFQCQVSHLYSVLETRADITAWGIVTGLAYRLAEYPITRQILTHYGSNVVSANVM